MCYNRHMAGLSSNQNLKIGGLVKAGWRSPTRDSQAQALVDKILGDIHVWAEHQMGSMMMGSIVDGTHGVIVEASGSMIKVQWPKCIGWVYTEAVTLIQE